ncbi:MAG: GFA family protein [Rhodospirillales bacterium]
MKITGGCHCERITYEAEIDPGTAFLCHCDDCQIMSGTAYRTVVRIPESDFVLKSGTLKVYVKTSESGRRRAMNFCGDCGTHIYATSVGDGEKAFGLRLGTVDQRRDLRPSSQWWHRSALDWVGDVETLPAHETQ